METSPETNTEAVTSKPARVGREFSYFYFAVGAASTAVVFWWLQSSTASICCGDFDGYYHIKWSQLLWAGLRSGHLPRFVWLPLTTLNPARYADQHFLFHLLLIPFTWFADLRVAAKVAAATFGTAAVSSIYWLILRYRIRYPLLWFLALLGCSWSFYLRMNMTKAQSVSILFIVAGIFLLFERRYIWLAPTAFLYVWAYNLFVMLGVMAVIWCAALWWTERRIEWRPLLWGGFGMVAGLIVNPYFPNNIHLFLEHLLAKSGQLSVASGVGSEWYALPSWFFLTGSYVACLSMVLGYIAYGHTLASSHGDKTRMQRPLFFLVFSSFLLLITLRSSRFMEYWPPFAVLFTAFTLQAVWDHPVEVESSLPKPANVRGGWLGPIILGLLLTAAVLYNLRSTQQSIVSVSRNPDHYRGAAEWLQANVPSSALIYNVNFTDFPKLFFEDATHNYVSGLDPLYLLHQHPEVSQLNDRLSSRQESDPAAAIRSVFAAIYPSGVSYVFVGDDPAPPPPDWFRYIQHAGKFKQVYGDKECVILQALDAPENVSQGSAAPAMAAPSVPQSQIGKPEAPEKNSPEQRLAVAAVIQRKLGGEIYTTVEENFQGAPGLIIHNKNATEAWAKNLFAQDLPSQDGEVLWQLGFRKFAVTNDAGLGWIATISDYRRAINERKPKQ